MTSSNIELWCYWWCPVHCSLLLTLCVLSWWSYELHLYLSSNTHQKLLRILYCANMSYKWLVYDHQVQFKSIMSYFNEAHSTIYTKTHTKYSTERCNSPFHTAGHFKLFLFNYFTSAYKEEYDVCYISYVNIGRMISTAYQTW